MKIKSKTIPFISIIGLLIFSCKKENSNNNFESNYSKQQEEIRSKPIPVLRDGRYAEMTFGKMEHDFGTIEQGKKVACIFEFKNTGKSDLIIKGANGSCGCTVPEYSKEPIKPGDKGQIKVSFDSSNKIADQHKTVTIFSNIKQVTKILNITANVVPKGTK